jgi:glycosyltransferase involved in cell wall biosynthesis
MSLPKFTVFIPTYNAGLLLESCLRSIRGQDYPADRVEILVVDGGSNDATREIAAKFGATVLDNPKKLAHFAFNVCGENASGELLVQFAADNELARPDWLKIVSEAFSTRRGLAAVWGRQITTPGDPPINGYYALIQNDPLSWFVNRNLRRYMEDAETIVCAGVEGRRFLVDPERSLVWGANGLVLRFEWVRSTMLGEFVGDNDVFQIMIESGRREVAYFPELGTAHHHVRSVGDWIGKWRRNFSHHFLEQHERRNMRWGMGPTFLPRLALWIVYAGIPVFSALHALGLAVRDRDWRWIYHPVLSWLQLVSYGSLTLFTRAGIRFLRSRLARGKMEQP